MLKNESQDDECSLFGTQEEPRATARLSRNSSRGVPLMVLPLDLNQEVNNTERITPEARLLGCLKDNFVDSTRVQ